MKHHHTLLTIALGPFLLILLFSASAEHTALGNTKRYTQLAEESFQEMKRLDQEFVGLQRTHSLLTNGKEKVMSPSLLRDYLAKETSDSPRTQYADLGRYLSSARDAIQILQARFVSIGRKAIHVNLSEQKLALIENGMIIATYKVSSGARDTPTPTGNFQIRRKQTLRVSNLEVPYRMPYYLAFTPSGSHGLHALPYLGDKETNSDYWHEARSHIGIPVSHGCVRLLPEDAEKIYQWADIGTKVIIHA